jgi:predicted enzyme related to lactoylglutathione lyase
MKNQINWFEIPVSDMDRAISFYSNVFGYEMSREESPNTEMALFQGNAEEYGATGCLVKYDQVEPYGQGTVVYFSVEDLTQGLKRVRNSGGKVVLPKTDIGEHGYYAHFIDTEGNRIALHSLK